MILEERYSLDHGIQIPKLGLGTWCIDDNQVVDVVSSSIQSGYRLIDTAEAYGNERGVGEGIRKSGVKREDLFIASKVAAEHKTYEDAKEAINKSLERMKLDYLDQIIIHSPQPWTEFGTEYRYEKENKEVWRALEEAYDEGKVKVIGVSNFNQSDLENILSSCKIKPMVNQILLHISNTDLDLLDYCNKHHILVEAYSPIAHGEALKNPSIIEMSEKYHVSTAALCIRYVIQLGTIALPKSANINHIIDNTKVDFEISKEDMEILKHLEHIHDYGEYNNFPVYSGKPL